MQIQMTTDNHIRGDERLATHVAGVVEHALDRFSTRITRVSVHLADENAGKGRPDDKRCVMEAHLEHRRPTAVTEHASTLDEAIQGAAQRLKQSLESAIGRSRYG